MRSDSYPDYSLESFGGKAASPRPARNPLYYLFLGCGGASLAGLGLCLCCLGLSFYAIRQPPILVEVWGSYMSNGQYNFAETITCQNSQAQDFTESLAAQNADFPLFGSAEAGPGENQVSIRTEIILAGERQDWEAIFTVTGGGVFGRCIETIEEVEISPDGQEDSTGDV